MRVPSSIRTALLSFSVIAGLAAVVAVPSNAVEDTESTTANTIKVAPVRSDITVNPGESKTVEVTVSNPSNSTITVRSIQNDFVAEGEDGTPALILDENESAPRNSLKQFLRPVENVTIPAGGAETVELEIAVPEGAEAGGYFGALRFAPTDPDDGGQVNLSASVASLILLTVPGDIEENLDLTNLDVTLNGDVRSFFTDTSNMEALIRFENDSRVQLAPFGKISVLKGDDLVHEVDFNSENQQRDVVLPDSARRWTVPLENTDGFGRYTLTATFTYGSTNQTIEMTKSFWVVPVWVMVVAAVLLLALIGLVVFLLRQRAMRSNVKKSKSVRR